MKSHPLAVEKEQILGIPVGYRPGLGRDCPPAKRSHLYKLGEDIMDFGDPMCRYGWNRDGRESYSIWRGNIGRLGICKICMRRALAGLDGVLPEGYVETPCSKCGQLTLLAKEGEGICDSCFCAERPNAEEIAQLLQEANPV
jgi:hypothetical protein